MAPPDPEVVAEALQHIRRHVLTTAVALGLYTDTAKELTRLLTEAQDNNKKIIERVNELCEVHDIDEPGPEATRADAEDQLEDIDGWKKPRSLFHDMPSTKTTEDQAKLSETSDHEISDDEDDEVITRESMKSGGLNGSKLALERKLDKEMTTKNDNAKVRDFGKGRGTNGKLIEIEEDEDEGEKSYPPPKDHRSQSSTKGLPDECHECGEPGGRGDPLTRCIAIRCEIATHFGEECSGDDGVPNKGWLCPKHAKLKADATMLSKKSKKHVRAPSPEIHIPAKKARRDESMLPPPRPGKSRRQTPVTRVSDTPSPREPYRSTRTRRR